MTISELARSIGLDRSYLGSIFKEQLSTSLQNYLKNYRMDKACELMKNETLSIGELGLWLDDPLLFSKLFRKCKGVSPREYRRRYHM